MLVLSRKVGQTVVIDNGTIYVTVLRAYGDHISIGFHAPEGITIDREEIFLRKLADHFDFFMVALCSLIEDVHLVL